MYGCDGAAEPPAPTGFNVWIVLLVFLRSYNV